MRTGLVWYFTSILFIPSVVCVSFSMVGLVANRITELPVRSLSRAMRQAFETLGMATFFFLLNIFLGLVILDVAKLLTHAFLSHYMIEEWTVPCFSLFEALVLKAWIEGTRDSSGDTLSGEADMRAIEKVDACGQGKPEFHGPRS